MWGLCGTLWQTETKTTFNLSKAIWTSEDQEIDQFHKSHVDIHPFIHLFLIHPSSEHPETSPRYKKPLRLEATISIDLQMKCFFFGVALWEHLGPVVFIFDHTLSVCLPIYCPVCWSILVLTFIHLSYLVVVFFFFCFQFCFLNNLTIQQIRNLYKKYIKTKTKKYHRNLTFRKQFRKQEQVSAGKNSQKDPQPNKKDMPT